MPDEGRTSRAVGFLDLAGYTSLTDVHGDATAVEVVARFCDVVRDALGPGDRLVKSIGDAVLVHSQDPAMLASLSARICATLDAEPAFPVLRVGLHAGPVVLVDGDVFGGTVNVAARLAAQARGGQVLASRTFSEALPAGRWPTTSLGDLPLKGLSDPVAVVELELCPHPGQRLVDPVCGMAVDGEAAAATVTLGREQVVFCSVACLVRWATSLPAGPLP